MKIMGIGIVELAVIGIIAYLGYQYWTTGSI